MYCNSYLLITISCLVTYVSSIVMGSMDDPDCLKKHSLTTLPDDCERHDNNTASVINEDFCKASLEEIKCWDEKTLDRCEAEAPPSSLVQLYYSADLQAYVAQGEGCRELKIRVQAYMEEVNQDLKVEKAAHI
ncbi:hypothetical protein Ddc_17688 [Ditylenchus destructor]|nr:hypothetical protein Ddc_17688 [Ditylenchus destructor]